MRAEAWRGCYGDGWQGLIVPDAFAHPAKVSRGLAARIYDHCREEGWLAPGDSCLDPFAGIGGFALDCMRIGCHFIGIELEQKFVDLAAQNIALWHRKFHRLPNWGTARVLQGDSRTLLAWQFAGPKVDAVVGSPPHGGNDKSDRTHLRRDERRLGADFKGRGRGCFRGSENYGDDPSNLGNLPPGNLDAVIASPPYAESVNAGDGKGIAAGSIHKLDPNNPFYRPSYNKEKLNKLGGASYGSSPGQLGQMREGSVEAVVSSPPYEASLNSDHHGLDLEKCGPWRGGRTLKGKAEKLLDDISYHAGPDNLGNSSGDTFWSASRQILEQVFLAVKPGGHCVWVTKAYVRKSKLVDFPDQWRQLCEAVGFRTLHEHRALLVEDDGTHLTTEGGEQRMTRERKSFFRRLAERKGAPRIDWETVWCLERP